MNLLERIANSNGDPQKTIEALRLLNQQLQHQVVDYTEPLATHVAVEAAAVRCPGEITGHSGTRLVATVCAQCRN